MISASQHGQGRRTYEEEDEEVDCMQQKVELVLEMSWFPSPSTIIFISSLHALPFSDALCKSLLMQEIGKVRVTGAKDSVSTMYYSDSFHVLLVTCHSTNRSSNCSDPSELGIAYAKLFDRFEADVTVVLGEYNIMSYSGAAEEGALLQLSTRQAICQIVPKLEAQNLVTGLAAALLCHAESRNRKCMLFLTLSRAYLTTASMKAFELLVPHLQALIGTSNIAPPSPASYTALIKRDPYVHRTENMYS